MSFHRLQAEHVEDFTPQVWQEEAWGECYSGLKNLLKIEGSVLDYSWVYLSEGQPIVIMGAIHKWGNYWTAWAFLSDQGTKAPFCFVRQVKDAIPEYMDELGIERLEATTNRSNEKARRFAEFLGFRHEGVLAKYGLDGEDYDVLSIVKEVAA